VTKCLRAGIVLFLMVAIGGPRAALAEDYTRIDLSDSTLGFSSPGDAYGPWIYQDLRTVFVQPGEGAVNFEFAHQADGDVAFPTHGEYFAGGITHDFNRRIWVWGQFAWGTSLPYPRTDVHIEMAYKATPDLHLAINAAEDFVEYPTGADEKLFQAGPTYFYPTGVVQLRYLCSANSGAQTKSGVLAAWDIVPTFRQKYTITGLFGPQQYQVFIPGIPIALFNANGETYTVSTEQQLGRTGPNGLRWGLKVAGLLTHLTNATTGAPIYTGRGATVGLWTTFPQ
jgi:hypothetical protein